MEILFVFSEVFNAADFVYFAYRLAPMGAVSSFGTRCGQREQGFGKCADHSLQIKKSNFGYQY
ncbi:hypothetical protein FLJC2902T_17020 [Flavobacterium limnosediminis JC2902]|uniref:Uncharacterized protein n=1 Tax=Flavobacterium limnosediminis JC2902 TaxID=1341181 RepID=V6SP07_9FLAO|nr:hypothetical protein FLJC2902T_17020 [Flavobacterium limnosediminis JC2902]